MYHNPTLLAAMFALLGETVKRANDQESENKDTEIHTINVAPKQSPILQSNTIPLTFPKPV